MMGPSLRSGKKSVRVTITALLPASAESPWFTEDDVDSMTDEELRELVLEDLVALYEAGEAKVERVAAQPTTDPEVLVDALHAFLAPGVTSWTMTRTDLYKIVEFFEGRRTDAV